MKAKFALSAICCLFALLSFGQNRTIKGHVLADSTREALSGINVNLKGTKRTVSTNAQGEFTIEVPATGAVLVFSSASYTRQELPVGGKTTVDVTLVPNSTVLNDVVVIGYQTVKRKDLLASVSSVSARDLKDIPINSAAEALNGRLAGVTATTAEGSPDAQVRIRIRGGMSINQDNTPLYVIDGVQVENGLATISPQDIQSIDVLKDAAATAIYGSRGANGVIIITTKTGKAGKLSIALNLFGGVKKLARKLEVMNPYDFVYYQSERNRGSSTDSTNVVKAFGTWDKLNTYRTMPSIDWQDEVFGETGTMQTANLAISGGNKKITFNTGGTYNREKAIVINSNYERILFNAKVDYKITNRLKLNVGGRYYSQQVTGAGVSSEQGSAYNRLRNAVRYRPFKSDSVEIDEADPLIDPNAGNGLTLFNPIQLANAEYRKKSTQAYNVTGSITFNITKNLTFRSTFGYDRNKVIDRQFSDSITNLSIIQGSRKPVVRLDTTDRYSINNSNVLTYSLKNVKKKHDFDFLLGEETYELRTKAQTIQFRNYPTFTPRNTAFTETDLGTPFAGYPRLPNERRETFFSLFGRVSYAYKDKYLFSANMRADASSKFVESKRWGTFPSASFAWRASKEKFMKEVRWVSDLKVRLGYGKIGNARIADYLYQDRYSNNGNYYYGLNGNTVIATYPPTLPNPNLQWESTVSRNAGLDLSLFKNRMNMSLDVYYNTSDKLLLDVNIAQTYGYTSQVQNVGKTSNRGVELQLGGTVIQGRNFSWTANFNISTNRNKVEALAPGQKQFFPDASWGVSGQPADYLVKVGEPLGSIYGLVTDGFYTTNDFTYDPYSRIYTLRAGVTNSGGVTGIAQPGSIKFKDLNGDGRIDLDNDRKIIGNANPKFTGGLNQAFTYKNWDASVFVNFSVGNDVYNANKIEFTNGYVNNANMLAIMSDRWKTVLPNGQTAEWVETRTINGTAQQVVLGVAPEELSRLNANARIWMPLKGTGAFYPHSWAVEDGSFLRLNNVTIGYTVPMGNKGIKKLRFYFTGNNLGIITAYTGYDPEVSVRNSQLTPGLDYSAYPKSRTYLFGVNAQF
jgi:TonB-linked SusC/RagA family outer membrane protein